MYTVFGDFFPGIRKKNPSPVRPQQHLVLVRTFCTYFKNSQFFYNFLGYFIEYCIIGSCMRSQKPKLCFCCISWTAMADSNSCRSGMFHFPHFLEIMGMIYLHVIHNICCCNIS